MSYSIVKKGAFFFFVACGALTGLEHLGANPFMKGHDTGFKAEPIAPPDGPLLELRSDMGEGQCWLQLSLGSSKPVSRTPTFRAHLANGHILAAILEPTREGAWTLAIADPDTNPSQRRLFTWPTGIKILLSATVQAGGAGQQVPLTMRDWTVWLAGDARDSKSRALWRKVFLILPLVSLAATMVVEVVKKSKKEKETEFTATACVQLLIDSI